MNGIKCVYGPSSQHPSGINHLFGDGSVRFVMPNVNVKIYDALVTPDGKELVEANDFQN